MLRLVMLMNAGKDVSKQDFQWTPPNFMFYHLWPRELSVEEFTQLRQGHRNWNRLRQLLEPSIRRFCMKILSM